MVLEDRRLPENYLFFPRIYQESWIILNEKVGLWKPLYSFLGQKCTTIEMCVQKGYEGQFELKGIFLKKY